MKKSLKIGISSILAIVCLVGVATLFTSETDAQFVTPNCPQVSATPDCPGGIQINCSDLYQGQCILNSCGDECDYYRDGQTGQLFVNDNCAFGLPLCR